MDSFDSAMGKNIRLVILDRDGVINHDSDAFIKEPDEWQAISGSLEAIARLNNAGIRVVIGSNQSGIGRGLFDIATLNRIHRKMHDQLSRVGGHLDGVFFCPHDPKANCRCRKPKPGLYLDIIERFGLPAGNVCVIGDRMRDLQPAWSIGAKAILVRTGHGIDTEKAYPETGAQIQDNLAKAVGFLIEQGC